MFFKNIDDDKKIIQMIDFSSQIKILLINILKIPVFFSKFLKFKGFKPKLSNSRHFLLSGLTKNVKTKNLTTLKTKNPKLSFLYIFINKTEPYSNYRHTLYIECFTSICQGHSQL